MSPSRAELGSWPFLFSSKKKIQLENRKIGIFSLFPQHFHSFFVFLRWMILFLLKITDFCPRKKRLELKKLYITKKIQLGFSSKIEVPDSAWKLFSSGNFGSNSSLDSLNYVCSIGRYWTNFRLLQRKSFYSIALFKKKCLCDMKTRI